MAKSKPQYRVQHPVNDGQPTKNRILVAVPMTGLLRAEWVLARYGQMTPCNWSQQMLTYWLDGYSPLRFSVADARNLVAQKAMEGNFEWTFFIDHDVVLPPDTLVRMNQYMLDAEHPIVNGLYFTKGVPAEPLVYRGLGTSYYGKWKIGQKVWADGCGLGCTIIHLSIFKEMAKDVETYETRGATVHRIFRQPEFSGLLDADGEKQQYSISTGTEDLDFYHRVKGNGVYKRAGWPKHQRKKYPLLIDTGIFCRHIDFDGRQFPFRGEENLYK